MAPAALVVVVEAVVGASPGVEEVEMVGVVLLVPFFMAAVPIALFARWPPFVAFPARPPPPMKPPALSSPKESQKSRRSGSTAALPPARLPPVAPALVPVAEEEEEDVTLLSPSMNLLNCSAAPLVPVWMFCASEAAVRRAWVWRSDWAIWEIRGTGKG